MAAFKVLLTFQGRGHVSAFRTTAVPSSELQLSTPSCPSLPQVAVARWLTEQLFCSDGTGVTTGRRLLAQAAASTGLVSCSLGALRSSMPTTITCVQNSSVTPRTGMKCVACKWVGTS